MIKKIAQSIEDIEFIYKNIVFNESGDILPNISERIRIAEEAVDYIKNSANSGENPFSFNYETNIIERLFGSVDFNSLSNEQKRSIINATGELMQISDLYSDDAVELISSVYEKYKNNYRPSAQVVQDESVENERSSQKNDEEPGKEQIFYTEEGASSGSSEWYVSEGTTLSVGERYYGPFNEKISACLYSILIHPRGMANESSVITKEYVDSFLKKNVVGEKRALSPWNGFVKNVNLTSSIRQSILEASDGKIDEELDIAGELFDLVVGFLKKEGLDSSNIKISDVLTKLDLNLIKKFATEFVEKYSKEDEPEIATDSNLQKDIKTTEPELETELKIDVSESKKLNIPASSNPTPKNVIEALDTSGVDSISIFNKIDQDLLSDEDILDFVKDMSERSSRLAAIDKNVVFATLDKCIEELRLFIKKIIIKDIQIKKDIFNFRQKNNIVSGNSTLQYRLTELEFQTKFSITKRLLQDHTVSSNLKNFFENICDSWFFKSESNLKNKIDAAINSFKKRNALNIDEQVINDAASYVRTNIIPDIRRLSRELLEKKLSEIINSPLADSIDKDLVLDEIILKDMKISSYISKYVDMFFKSKENVAELQKYYSIECGVCGQMTQIPSDYKDELSAFSNSTPQYSFFRDDNSYISESDLISIDYKPASEVVDAISSVVRKRYSKVKSKYDIDAIINGFVNKKYSWTDVNLMVFDPASAAENLEDQVLTNVIGHIIRNDMLKISGGSVSGGRGIFTNKALCASSLINLSESLRQDSLVSKFLENKRNYSCLGTVKAKYTDPNIENIEPYNESAFEEYSKTDDGGSDIRVGYRFSLNVINCPCHIGLESDIGKKIVASKSAEGLANLIAIPNVPYSVAKNLALNTSIELNEINSSPTTPDGRLTSEIDGYDISDIGFLVCGKKVSISMIDKDPSSKNYIRTVLSNILVSEGIEKLISVVKTLINIGVEINDIRPHVDSILSTSNINSIKSSRRNILNSLFKVSKISVAAKASDIDILSVKDIGLVCSSGHKFTVGQSWSFAKTHSAVMSDSKKRSISSKAFISVLSGNTSNILSSLISDKPSEGVGIIKVYGKDEVMPSDYILADNIKDRDTLIAAIDNRKLYFISGDLKYIVGLKSSSGDFRREPWKYGEIAKNSRTDLNILRYIEGMTSTTVQDESGGSVEMEIEDTSGGYSEQNVQSPQSSSGESRFASELMRKYDFAQILMPNITNSDIVRYASNPISSAVDAERNISEISLNFSKKLSKLFRMARVWARAAVDSQVDFLAAPLWVPKPDPNLNQKIKDVIFNFSIKLNISDDKIKDIYSRFFSLYDVNGLINRNVSYDKFISLAGIAQYYSGFSAPYIAGMSEKPANQAIQKALKEAVMSNIGSIFDIGMELGSIYSNKDIEEFSINISNLLLSIYEGKISKITVKECAVTNYTGRAAIFSYSIQIVNKIREFYQRYFLNKGSQLYIGDFGGEEYEVFDAIDKMLLSGRSSDESGAFVPNIIFMENDEFEKNIKIIEEGIQRIYGPQLAGQYSDFIGLERPEDRDAYYIQEAIILSRFIDIISMAISSIDYIITDIVSEPITNFGEAAKSLDLCAEDIIMQRAEVGYGESDPSSVDERKKEAVKRILNSRTAYGESDNIFERNSVQYGALSLDPDRVSFENDALNRPRPMAISGRDFRMFSIKRSWLKDGDRYNYKRKPHGNDPYLILLKEIVVDGENEKTLYLCAIPTDILITPKDSVTAGISNNVDMISLIPEGTIFINTKQGLDFASRYVNDIDKINTSRLILVDSTVKDGYIFGLSYKDSAIKDHPGFNDRFDIRIQRIDKKPDENWPPQNNLLYNNYNVGEFSVEKPGIEALKKYDYNNYLRLMSSQQSPNFTENSEAYYKTLFGLDDRQFIANIDKFHLSETSRTMITSPYGIVLPMEIDDKKTLHILSNVNDGVLSTEQKNIFSAIKANIFANRDDGSPLDISWALLSRDPQVNDNGIVRTSLVQSGAVQKLKYISGRITDLYKYFLSKKDVFERIKTRTFSKRWIISFDSESLFIESLTSEESPILESDVSFGVKLVKIKERAKNIYSNDSEFSTNIYKLCDFYNAAQRLNKLYLEQQPLIDGVFAKNLAKTGDKSSSSFYKKDETGALCVRLLDPYSMWSIVTNPAMSSAFGGPINSSDIPNYKNFIITTFGLDFLVEDVCKKTGISDVYFKADDLFDLPSFYNRSIQNKNISRDSLKKLVDLFSLNINEDNNIDVNALGFPKKLTQSIELKKSIGLCVSSEPSINRTSQILFPSKVSHSLSDISSSVLNEIIANAEKKVLKMIDEITKSIIDKNPSISQDMLAEEISAEKDRRIREEILSNPDIVKSRNTAEAIKRGDEVPSLSALRDIVESRANVERPKELQQEMLHIMRDLWASETKKVGKDLSWRKIAQSATDDDGTIITSLYHRWWDAYLKTLAKNYYN